MHALAALLVACAVLASGCHRACGSARTSGAAPSPAPGASDAGVVEERVAIPPLGPMRGYQPPANIPARLVLPAARGERVPAMVIVVSSGCVVEAREPYYAHALADAGIAGLVVDSCTPRGVRTTVDDQTRMTSWEVENDAWAALVWLANDARIDRARIGIMGVSKGGTVSMNTALLVRRRWQRARVPAELAFAAHVPIVPGCSSMHRNAATTGAPMLFMLGGADDYTTAAACAPVVEALRAAGNTRVESVTFEGAHHGWEVIGEPRLLARAENYSRCRAIEEDDGSFVVDGGERIAADAFVPWARRTCMRIGDTHAGGGTLALKKHATDTLLGFLRKSGF
jgi:dienelactone hydrolase